MKPSVRNTALLISLAFAAFTLFTPSSADAQARIGSIQGRVVDQETAEAIAFADIILMGTGKGAISKVDGSYLLVQIPEGIYQVRVNRMGYKSELIDQVRVEAGFSKKLQIKMEPIAVREVEVIEVSGDRTLVDVEVATTSRFITSEEIEAMAVTVVNDVVSKQAGVVEQDDGLYVRGGRAEDTVFRIDGVVVRDLITGRSSAGNISARAVKSVEVITGGFDAEYGQALAGVIDIQTKDGASNFAGYGEYQTDHLPLVSKTYRNFDLDNFDVQLEGPEPISKYLLKPLGWKVPGKLSFFWTISGEFDDTYLDVRAADGGSSTLNSNYVDSFLGADIKYGNDFWTPRNQNRWQSLYKMSWQPGGKDKINLSFNKKLEIDHGFFRSNLVDVVDPGEPTSNFNYEWSRRKDHDYTYTDDTNTITFDWRHIWNRRVATTLRLSRNFSAFFQNVHGRPWFSYEEPQDQDLSVSEDDAFFVNTGDNDVWHNRYTEAYVGYSDVSYEPNEHHRFKAGIEASYENIQFVTIAEPWVQDPDGLGLNHDLWQVYPTTGSWYVQDKFNFEGFIGNVGLRYDYWFPGTAAERALEDTSREAFSQPLLDDFDANSNTIFGRKFKGELLPRFQVSHPITDHSHLFFNYGHFSQRPNYYYVYSKLTSVSSEDFPLIGNLNLDSKRTVKYEIGARHQFRKDLAMDFSVFYNDIYDYPTSARFDRPGDSDFFVYINEDFARSRGIELEVRKKRSKYLWARAAYTFSTVTGKASDPNGSNLLQETFGSFTQIGRDEEFLFWNRPHKLTLDVTLSVGPKTEPPKVLGYTLPQDWSLNLYFWVQSGRAFTPTTNADEETATRNSANAPLENTFDLRYRKGFHMLGSKLNYLLEVRNIFNTIYPRRIDSITGEGYAFGEGFLDRELTPTDLAQYSDPSFNSRPRSIRLGISGEF